MKKVERFDRDVHEAILKGWLMERGLDGDANCSDLPGIGYISFVEDIPIATAFLRRCEGPYAMLDGLASNPKAESFHRHLGIELVVTQVIECAQHFKLKKLLAYSIDAGTLERSLHHGFKKLPHTLIGLDLEVQNGFHRVTAFK